MAKYGFTLSNGKQAVVTANSEDEARAKKDAYEAKLNDKPPARMKPGIRWPGAATAFPLEAGLAKTGQSIASLIPESIGGPDPAILKDAIAREQQTLDEAGGMGTAAEIGAQTIAALPLAAATAYAAPAAGAYVAGAKTLSQFPKVASALGKLTTAGTAVTGAAGEGALLAEPGQKDEAAGLSAAIQTGFESLPLVGKALGVGMKYGGKGAENVTDWMMEQAKKLFEKNPGLSKTAMAKRLEEMVTGLDVPLANAAKSDMVRRVAQIVEYFPLSGARETYKKAEKRIRDELLDIAEGSTAPPKVPHIEDEVGIIDNIKRSFAGEDAPYTRATQKRFKQIQKTASDDYDRVINTKDFDPQQTFENVVVGLSQNSDAFVRDITGDVVKKLRKTINPDTGRVSGRQIGTLKAELRALIPDDAPPYKKKIMRDVIKQIDDDLAKQMPAEDAARFVELNQLHPNRVMAKESLADVPLGEFDAQTARNVLKRESGTAALSVGEARSQELIDLSAEIMKRKPPSTSSPWAMAALLSSAFTMFAPVVGTVAGRTQLANMLRHGDVPKALLKHAEFKNLRKWAKSMSDAELFEVFDKIRPATVTGSGVAGAEMTEER